MVRTLAIVAAAVGCLATAADAQVRYIPRTPRWNTRVNTPRVGVRFGSRGTSVRYSNGAGFGYRSGPRGTNLRFSNTGVRTRTSCSPRVYYSSPRRVVRPRRYVQPRRVVRPRRYVQPRRFVQPRRTVVVRPQRTVVVRPQRTVIVDPCPPTIVVQQPVQQRPQRVVVQRPPEPSSVRVDMTDPTWNPVATGGGFERRVTVGNSTTTLPNTEYAPSTVQQGTGRSSQPRSSVNTGRTRGTTWVSTGRSRQARGFDTGRNSTLDVPKPRALARALLQALEAGNGDRACALARWLDVRPELWAPVEIAFYSELPSPLMLRSARRDLARDCQGTAGFATLSRLLGAR